MITLIFLLTLGMPVTHAYTEQIGWTYLDVGCNQERFKVVTTFKPMSHTEICEWLASVPRDCEDKNHTHQTLTIDESNYQ